MSRNILRRIPHIFFRDVETADSPSLLLNLCRSSVTLDGVSVVLLAATVPLTSLDGVDVCKAFFLTPCQHGSLELKAASDNSTTARGCQREITGSKLLTAYNTIKRYDRFFL